MSSWKTSQWAEELRQLWNEYDPIGVFPVDKKIVEWPDDEYGSYHGIIIKHLNKGSGHEWIFKDVKHAVTVNIGMTWNSHLEKSTNEFVSKVLTWFETKQPELKK